MPRNLPAVEQLAALDGVVYFSGRDEGHGQELWQSDGTPQGTKLVKDLNPGKGSSFPSYLVAAGSKLFFFASALEGGFQLWTSDGTAAGTVPIGVIGDGRRESVPFKPIVVGGKIFIITIGTRHEDSRLWASDGTADGTRLLPLPEATTARLRSISPMIAGNDLYFVSEGNLWRSDGTPEGTTVAMAFGGNGFQVWNAVEAGGRIYLSGQNEEHGLRRFNPASGQLEVPEFWDERMLGFAVYSLASSGDYLVFTGSKNDAAWEVWVSDGTSNGTHLNGGSAVKGLRPNWGEGIEVRGRHLMQGETSKTGTELWVSNGTGKGTKLLCNLAPGSSSSRPSQFTKLGDRAFFVASTPRRGSELWMSAATVASTDLVADLRKGKESSDPQELTATRNLIFWTADDGENGRQLWCSNGTRRGTRQLTSLEGGALPVLKPYPPPEDGYTAALGGRYFFPLADSSGYLRLWSSDGSSTGTRSLAAGLTGRKGSNPDELMTAGDRVYYQTFDDNEHGRLLWATGGDSANTSVVLDLDEEDDANYRYPGLLGVSGQTALLAKRGGGVAEGLWRHRQTESQAVPLAPGDAPVFPQGELAFFTSYDPATGREPYVTDGTIEGTRLLRDLRPKTAYDPVSSPPAEFSSSPQWVARVGSKTYFTAESLFYGRELWVTDGTPLGTVLVKDISGNSTSSIFGKVHVWGDKLLFFAGARTSYYEEAGLWISDGTSQGTRRLMIAAPDPWYDAESNDGPMFAELDGRIYFTAKTEEDGQELWSTDGTVDGTQRVKDIFPGSAGSEPEWLTSTGSAIYFTGNDGRHGRELWRTDGTADGTVLVKDFTMDAASSLPQGLAYTGGRLFFMATTPDAGAAAWVIDQP